MTGDNLPAQDAADEDASSVVVDEDPEVRDAIDGIERGALPGLVLAHPDSPLAWAELSEIAHSEGRELEAYAYATVAHQRGLDVLAVAGWSAGHPIPWVDVPNQGVLRAAYALQRSAAAIGRADEADALAAFLEESDPDAVARIVSEHTPTQLITVIPTPVSAPEPTQPVTEAFVIRGED